MMRYLLFFFLIIGRCFSAEPPETKKDSVLRTAGKTVVDSTVYLGSGILSGSVSAVAGAGWAVCQLTPWTDRAGKECLLLSKVCGRVALSAFRKVFKVASSQPFPVIKGPISHASWYLNRERLRQIPAESQEDAELLLFLQRRWLAKNAGYYSSLVDWLCPSFDISLQVHPESMGFYARDPSNKLFQTYANRVKQWKRVLPHPAHFPLILTRPADVQAFLPCYVAINAQESAEEAIAKLVRLSPDAKAQLIVDVTPVVADVSVTREQWMDAWRPYQDQLLQACYEQGLDPDQVICIQRLVGGLRLLPFHSTSKKWTHRHHYFVLEWLSKLGLTVNRVELDRLCDTPLYPDSEPAPLEHRLSREEVLSSLQEFEARWQETTPQKTLMVKGMVEIVRGLFCEISSPQWEEIMGCPTRCAVVALSWSHIQNWLRTLEERGEHSSFSETASHLEQIYAHVMPLLEIFSPFTSEAFARTLHERWVALPSTLKPLLSCGIHSSGMTSLTYVFKAVGMSCGRPPRVLYGENTYFESIHTAERVASAISIADAIETDWKEVDLILAQFNPALKRINFSVNEYRVERVAEAVQRALQGRAEEHPLVLALDCTFDFINSPKVEQFLTAFQEEIQQGRLNVICYRSGIKFDLFGMDNYCGAPVCVIHNEDPQWAPFDALLHDPALEADRLSLNWFCLAYHYGMPYLEGYRKQIFDNTRSLLDQTPQRMLEDQKAYYRVIPMEPDADAGFIDIKIFGPFHTIRGGVLVGGLLTLDCLQQGHPLFYRPSVGFYHPNLCVLFGKHCTTIRLTLGLDPDQVGVLAESFKTLDRLNGAYE